MEDNNKKRVCKRFDSGRTVDADGNPTSLGQCDIVETREGTKKVKNGQIVEE